MSSEDVTICITMGLRPELLRKTLLSLGTLVCEFSVLAVNDFGDEETNREFRSICPNGRIIDLGGHVGHHAAVDRMYRQVRTPYVMHLEDDWHFDRLDFLPASLSLLQRNEAISSVCLRSVDDFALKEDESSRMVFSSIGETRFARLDGLHPQWHGFTFNPHLSRRADWENLQGFSRFKKERHVSRAMRRQGRFVAYLDPGACRHIGWTESVAQPPMSSFKKFKKWARGRVLQR
ncbi:hypothetical protein [Thioclava atlantica]|uniref:Glycosyltransferase 2-like domain-containing protein n=1 Tax=Thioclava atlantica TaxID=1317124 RepID=A0A085TYL0_9RHOB|nr:hypothetical protein [Thioclava atlantica]KFE35807.1 hypothetical protein DW2_07583 [Thioclava atlantica]